MSSPSARPPLPSEPPPPIPSSSAQFGSSQFGSAQFSSGQFGSAQFSSSQARWSARLPAAENVWRTGELNDLGLNADAIRRLTAAGTLVRSRYGCYIRGSYWATLGTDEQRRVRILVHNHGTVATSPKSSVYSHTSAAALHGLCLWRADSFIHLSRTTKMSTTCGAEDVRHHACPVVSTDITEISGVRATTLERTVIDCAMTLPYKSALILMDHALRLGVDPLVLEQRAGKLDRHRGVNVLRRVLEYSDARSESPGETLTRDLIRLIGVEPPILQYQVETRKGRYRADFAWPRYRLILEFDGESKYFDFRPTDEVLLAERKREAALIEEGWTVLRISWSDLFNEHRFKTRLLAAMERVV